MQQWNVIHILYVVYDQFGGTAQHLAAAMTSVLENTESKICIHLFHNKNLPKNDIEKLECMIERYGQQFKSYEVDIDAGIINVIPRIAEYTPGVLYHLKVADLLDESINRVIYMDFDTIVHEDIRSLYEEDLNKNCIGLVPINEKIAKKMLEEDFPNQESPILATRYYNTGVMLMDLQAVRQKHNLWEESIGFLEKYPNLQYLDQTALCYVFRNEILPLKESYNCGVTRRQKVNVPGIYHYKGPWRTKPWNCVDKEISILYWKYLMKSQWMESEELLQKYRERICVDEIILKNPIRKKNKIIRMFILRCIYDMKNKIKTIC